MNPLTDAIEQLGLTSPGTYLVLFVAASLLMLWRLEALLTHGLEGTALGTLVMPYCSGLGNLIFVGLMAGQPEGGRHVLTNCLVNNVTNLTLVLALPTLGWGLLLGGGSKSGPARSGGVRKPRPAAKAPEQQLTKLSLTLSLAAALFFAALTWMLGEDGTLNANDGLVLVAVFLFWQCFQVFDVLKHNVRQRQSFSPLFYLDLLVVLLGAGGVYTSLDWLVTWLGAQQGEWVNAANLGWLTGWLMVLPNALLAFFYAARQRADIALASQIGDGHVCIPLCLGLSAALNPVRTPAFFETGLYLLGAAAIVHGTCILLANGLPRWMGWPLLAGYGVFIAVGWF